MKKRVLSLFLAFVLSFSMMPMSAFAEEAGTVTEQEAQSGEDTVGVSTSGEDTVEVPTTGEDISGGNAVTKDAAVEAAQSLIDALPEEVTAENADGLQAQLMAIDEALAALDEEQTAKLDMTRLENICVALTTFVAAQDGEHADHPICGLTCTHENKHDDVTEWEPIGSAAALRATQAGHHYYLTSDVTLTSEWTVKDNIVLCLNGHSIKQTGDDMVIYVQTGFTFSLCDCNRGDNAIEANGNYFGNAVEASGVFNMYGGVIRGSSKKGGVEVTSNNGSTFNMYGGEISGNKWGVDVRGSVANSGTFNMYGGIICNNKKGSDEGGGVVVEQNAIFNMSGGEISSNSANTGGGVCMKSSAAGFTMIGGEITKNSAQNGGGVYVGESSKFIMTGGEISGNTATKNGGGVYVDGTYGALTVSGAPKITGNTVSNAASNVLLSNNYKTITIGEGGLNSDAKIGVTVQSFPTTKASPVQFPAAGTDVTLTRTDANAFFIDNNTDNTYSVQLIDNKLYVYYGDLHRHPICGDVSCTDSSHQADVDWTGVSTLTNSMTAGYYYLTADVTLTASWRPKDGTVLCLNGHSITANTKDAAINLPFSDRTFTLTDCNDSEGKHYFKNDKTLDRWVPCENGDDGSFLVEGGVITHAADYTGGAARGVYAEYGTFIMYGGTICGHGTASGAGVQALQASSEFRMYGGAIKGNTAGTSYYGGGVYVGNGTFTMTGGTISDNRAECGGGVYMYNSTFNMTDGTISGNTATKGGGVHMEQYQCVFNMIGGTISDNKATGSGGGVCEMNGTFTMTGGSITDNTVGSTGGGVYLQAGTSTATFNLSGTPVISDNKNVDGTANNVYVYIYGWNGNPIDITGVLGEGAKIGVTPDTKPTDSPVYVAKFPADMSESDRESCAKKFFVDESGFYTSAAKAPNNSYYVAIQSEHHEHYLCGGDECTQIGGHSCENTKFKAWTSTTSLPTESGNWYLTDDVDLTGTWECENNVKLCLNGKTITGASGYAVIKVASGASLDITDCNDTVGQITHESNTNGCGIEVDGTLTLWNGKITKNTSDGSNGGGVSVNKSGSFTMNGGAITQNENEGVGGGVEVVSGGTFTMNGGEITGNTSTSHGGGVYAAGSFTMNGGAITGNNTTIDSTDICDGGVYVNIGSNFTVSGVAKIIDNWKNGKLSDGKYVQGTDGTAGNVYLSNGVTFTIGDGLTEEAQIGVSISKAELPKAEKNVQIATNAKSSQLDYNKIFPLDVNDSNYTVIRDNAGKLFIYHHQHSWNYTVSDDKTTIDVACGETSCPTKATGNVTIVAPEESTLTYDGSGKPATLENNLPSDVKAPKISYTKGSGQGSSLAVGSVPTDAGSYTASITLGGVTASVTYEIAKATPKADDFTFTAPSDLTYDGSAKFATIKTLEGINGMGEFTWKYKQGQTGKMVSEPTDADTYTVVISVAEGDNYKLADNLSSAAWMFEIQRNSTKPIVELSENKTYTYTGSEIRPRVTVKTIDGKTLVEGTDYMVSYGENKDVGEGTIIVDGLGNYSFKNVVKSFPIEKAEQPMHFEQESVDDKTYSDCGEFVTNPLTRTVVAGAVTYSSSNEDVATVDSDGIATIVGVGTATITATAEETENYKTGTASYTLTVGQALLRVNGEPSVTSKSYDGETDAEVTVFFVNEKGRPVTLAKDTEYTVTGTFSSPDASDSEQTVDVKITLSEDCAKNYKLEAATYETNGYIYARPISIVSATAVGREYKMGDTSVTISGVTFNGVVEGEELKKDIDYEVTGEIYDDNAGTKDDVEVTVTLTGKAAKNYDLGGRNTTQTKVNIKQATPVITVAATEQTIVKNGAAVDISDWASINNTDDTTLTYKLVGTPAGITLEGVSLTAENAASTVSNFEIRVTADATTNFTEPEEKIITVKVTDKADAGVRITGETADKTYGDKDFTLKATKTAPDGGTWSWSSDASGVLEISGADTDTPTIKVKKAGTAILTVTYTSDTYIGVANISITVNPKAITADMIGNIDAQEYTGKDIKPTPEVKDGTTKLTNDTDFTYSYSNNRNAGTATLTITGKGNYKGEVTKNFTISKKSINDAIIELANKSFAYTGSEQTVNITSVKLSDGTILGTDDYVIKDNSNKATNAGEITLTIEGKGNYTGTATTTWAITKAVPKLADFDVVPDLSNELTYSGEEQIVNVTTKAGIRGMGMITVRYNGSTERPVNAGNYAITIDVADGSNYKAISGIEAGTLTIKKAAAPTLADVKVDHAYATTGNQTVSLAELVKSAKSYAPGEITGNTETEILSDINVTGDGVLQYTLTGKGVAGSTVTIPVAIISTNYEETTVNVVITIKQATPTGAPGYDFIHDSSKTLKDAGLDLINSTLNPKEGTLEWIDSNGKVLPGETKLEEGKKYIWRFTPDDPNYAVITGELELYAPYRILDGADSTWTQSTDGTIAIRGNGDFEKFQSVKVDGVVVDAKNYTVAKGSTIITFKEDYLKTLSTGSHTFELVWTDGSAATKFSIAAKPDNGDNNNSDNNNNDKNDDSDNDTVVIGNVSSGNNTVPAVIGAPKTGDASGIWMTLFAVSLAGLAAMLVRKKNNRE